MYATGFYLQHFNSAVTSNSFDLMHPHTTANVIYLFSLLVNLKTCTFHYFLYEYDTGRVHLGHGDNLYIKVRVSV